MKLKLQLLPLSAIPLFAISCSSNKGIPKEEKVEIDKPTETDIQTTPTEVIDQVEITENATPIVEDIYQVEIIEEASPIIVPDTPSSPVHSEIGFDINITDSQIVVVQNNLNLTQDDINQTLDKITPDLFDYDSYDDTLDTNHMEIVISNISALKNQSQDSPTFDGNEKKFLVIYNTKSAVVYRYGYLANSWDTFKYLFYSDNLDGISNYMIYKPSIYLNGRDGNEKFDDLAWHQTINVSKDMTDEMKDYLNISLPEKLQEISKTM